MKFFYVTDILLNEMTAQTVHVDEVCKNLVLKGHEVVLYAPKSLSFEGSGYSLKAIPVPMIFRTVFYQIQLTALLLWGVWKKAPSVLYVRHSLLLIVPTIIGKICGIPVVLEVNGKLIDEAKFQRQNLIGSLLFYLGIFRLFEYVNFELATRIITVTKGIQDTIYTRYRLDKEKISVIQNGVNPVLFSPLPSNDTRKQIGLEPQVFYVGYIGSFFKWQGLQYVAEVAHRLKSSHPGIKFVLVGAGDEKEALTAYRTKNKLSDSFLIQEPVSRELVPLFINAFDVCLCVPTRFRNGATSPFKVYEYLACGKAVIVSDIEGMRDEFGDVVRYVEPESTEELALAIEALASSSTERDRLGREGRQFVEKSHSWEVVTERIIILCKEALSTTPCGETSS